MVLWYGVGLDLDGQDLSDEGTFPTTVSREESLRLYLFP